MKHLDLATLQAWLSKQAPNGDPDAELPPHVQIAARAALHLEEIREGTTEAVLLAMITEQPFAGSAEDMAEAVSLWLMRRWAPLIERAAAVAIRDDLNKLLAALEAKAATP